MARDRIAAEAATELAEGGVELGRYVLEGRIGEGGMGAVYRAHDREDGRPVAIKILKERTPDLVRRFLREARIAASVQHPNMVRVYEVIDREAEPPALVMELLEGESFAARLARVGRMSVEEVAPLVIAVARAIEAAHARGVVHRDLKPDNIFIAVEGDEPGVAKVLDFGIAKLTPMGDSSPVTGGALTRTGQILGTPQYMAPEVIFGEEEIDARADIWSLGVILYEALAGERPFDGDNPGQVFKAIALDPYVPLASRMPLVSPSVAALVDRMLAHARAERLSDLSEVVSVLEPFISGGGPTPPVTAVPVRRRNFGRSALIAAGAMSVCVSGVIAWARANKAQSAAAAAQSVVHAPLPPASPSTSGVVLPSATPAAPTSATASTREDRRRPNAPRAPLSVASSAPSSPAALPAPRHRSGELRPEELLP